MHSDIGHVASFSFGLVLAKPVVASVVVKDASSVGVDMYVVIVQPDLSGCEGLVAFFCLAGEETCCQKYCKRYLFPHNQMMFRMKDDVWFYCSRA